MVTEVILRFRNQKEKAKFLIGLADGFGEEHCQLSWGAENGVSLKEAKVIDITPWGPFDNSEDEDDFDDFGMEKMTDENASN